MNYLLDMNDSSAHKKYPAVGRCIYCGACEKPLSDEHIIPFGINGSVILAKASCNDCADITKKFEQFCLREIYGPLRYRQNMRTRRKKQRPSSIKTIVMNQDGTIEPVEIPIKDYPLIICGFKLPPPGIIELINRFEPEFVTKNDDGINRIIPPGKGIKINSYRFNEFCRLLAKIAHGFAVAELGFDGFEHMLPDLILGKSENFWHLIGGEIEGQNVVETRSIVHGLRWIIAQKNNLMYVVVIVKLFTFNYSIVAGVLKKPLSYYLEPC